MSKIGTESTKIELNNYKCSKCGTRHPTPAKTCFYCGNTDSIIYDRIKKGPRVVKQRLGATISIRLK